MESSIILQHGLFQLQDEALSKICKLINFLLIGTSWNLKSYQSFVSSQLSRAKNLFPRYFQKQWKIFDQLSSSLWDNER